MSLVTIWQKTNDKKILFLESFGRFFNDDKYSGSSIDSIYRINTNEFIITGNRFGGDGGVTEGGIWVASWKIGVPMKILKTFNFFLSDYSIEDINYIFNEEKMELTFSTDIEQLKDLIPKNTIKILKN